MNIASETETYSFTEMSTSFGPRLYVIHNESGCTLPYNHGKDQSIPEAKKESHAEWARMSRKQRKQLWKEWREKMELRQLIPATRNDYYYTNLEESKPSIKERIKGMQRAIGEMQDYDLYPTTNSFAKLQQEKENTMQTLNIVAHADQSERYPTEQRQRDHLIGRLHEIKCTKNEALRVQFGLAELPRPKSAAELVEYIKAGKYVFTREDDLVNEDFDYNEFYYSPWSYLEFRDPEVKKDREGYEKAKKALEKLYDDTRDEIVVLDVEKGLAAVRQFETTSVN